MQSVSLAFIFLILASGASALDLAPGTYAISAVGFNLCAGCYLAYDTKGSGTGVYLIPSVTSHPPLWSVAPAPGSPGAFLLTAVNRTDKARAVLIYDPLSCSDVAVSLGFNGNATWANAGGYLNAARRECPPGSAVALAPAATTGAARCRAVVLVSAAVTPDPASTTWHFTRFPGKSTELLTKGYARGISKWAPSTAMDDALLVEGAYYDGVPQPTFWKRGAGGVWRRGTLNVPGTVPPVNDILSVGIGDKFVAVGVPVPGTRPKKPYWRAYVYDKAKLGGAPTATLTAPGATGNIGVLVAAGGVNLAVTSYPNRTFVFSLGKGGKWGAPVTLPANKSASVLRMSRDGRTLALSVSGEELIERTTYTPLSSGRVLVFRQAKAGGAWAQEADIAPPPAFGILVTNPDIALDGDNLVVAFHGKTPSLMFYRRSAGGVWKLVQSAAPPCDVYHLAADADTAVAACPYDPATKAFVYKRSKATGKWASGKARPLPTWDDDFVKNGGGEGRYGEMALRGKRLALTAAFASVRRSSPGVTFIYDNVGDL